MKEATVIVGLFNEHDSSLSFGLIFVSTVTSVPGKTDLEAEKCASLCHFAFDMVEAIEDYCKANPHRPLSMRIGINCGPVVAGIVGTKRFLYDIWGDA